MRKLDNRVHVEGRFYEADLKLKTVQKQGENFGMQFYNGTLSIATDEDCTNIVRINYGYIPEKRKGEKNQTFENIQKLLTNNKSVVEVGKDEADYVAVNTSFVDNSYWSDKRGEIVSEIQIRDGFLSLQNKLNDKENERTSFCIDILVNKVNRVEKEEGEDSTEMAKVRGAIFNFRNEIYPIDLVTYLGIDFFEDLVSDGEAHLVKVFGVLDYTNIKIEKEEESAFGGPIVTTRTIRKKDFVIDKALPNELEFDDDSEILTPEEVKKALQDREVKLASVKTDWDAYQASKNSATTAASGVTSFADIPKEKFKF